jgi:hypothetical protein
VGEKVWAESRQLVEEKNTKQQLRISNGFDGFNADDVEEIPRAPSIPNDGYIDPSDGSILRRTLLWWCSSKEVTFARSLAFALLHRFGPHIDSNAVRHAILRAQTRSTKVKYLEHSVLSARHARDAISRRAYVEVLIACFFMAVSCVIGPNPDYEEGLKHIKAARVCLKEISPRDPNLSQWKFLVSLLVNISPVVEFQVENSTPPRIAKFLPELAHLSTPSEELRRLPAWPRTSAFNGIFGFCAFDASLQHIAIIELLRSNRHQCHQSYRLN